MVIHSRVVLEVVLGREWLSTEDLLDFLQLATVEESANGINLEPYSQLTSSLDSSFDG